MYVSLCVCVCVCCHMCVCVLVCVCVCHGVHGIPVSIPTTVYSFIDECLHISHILLKCTQRSLITKRHSLISQMILMSSVILRSLQGLTHKLSFVVVALYSNKMKYVYENVCVCVFNIHTHIIYTSILV